MIKVFNHKAESLDSGLLISEDVGREISDICIQYHGELPVTKILETIQREYGFSFVVFASFILGKIEVMKTNNLINVNQVLCLKEN